MKMSGAVALLAFVLAAVLAVFLPACREKNVVNDVEDPCQGVACSDHGQCAVVGDLAVCICDAGYHSEALTCIENVAGDECSGVTCSDHGTCVVVRGDPDYPFCICDQGYRNDGDTNCVRDGAPDPCEEIDCGEHGQCTIVGDDTAICICDAGYHAEGLECVENGEPLGLVWVSIPATGTFEMGCSPGDTECFLNYESPRHSVNVSAFSMTETEITQAQYEAVTGGNPSHFSGCPDCPVDQVTWHEAKAFCEAIGGRLPSETEWEYAARAGTTTRYYCGDDSACLDGIAWYGANSGDTTHPVGEKTANAFGLYDILGNVWEWVEDCWHEDYVGAPSTGEVWSDGDCSYRGLRGGTWLDDTRILRVSFRHRGGPNSGLGWWGYGFRCAQ